jgi:hypothetical protein
VAKGIASRNSLKALAHPIQQFVNAWGASSKPAKADGLKDSMPAPYELAALRGEGILRERFFGAFVSKIPVTLDAAQQVALWSDLVEEGGQVTAWVQRLGVAKALRREASLPEHAARESRKLYAILLDALATQSPDLLPWAVEGYFLHVWKGRFAKSRAEAQPESSDAAVLRERLKRALRRKYGEAVEVKESFHQGEESVRFSVLAKRASLQRWEEVAVVERPRLKTARLAGYGAALEGEMSAGVGGEGR